MKFRLYTRVLRRTVGVDSAYACLASNPESCSALLENPVGGGRHFLVSRAGTCLSVTDIHDPDAILARWRRSLRPHPVDGEDIPGIRCLIYAAYEAGALVERLPAPKTTPPGPVLHLFFPEWSICFQPAHSRVHLLSVRGADVLDALEAMVDNTRDPGQPETLATEPPAMWATDEAAYLHAVMRAKAYIAAGDIFQANIARYWRMSLPELRLLSLYGCLRRVNPAPFAAFVRIEAGNAPLHVLSASPERLFRISGDGCVETRPIAGTRRRGNGARDQALGREMLLSEKERAEHIMLVDLERNDLGRVCRPGTVEVNERMVVERYATVQHIVSNVRGRLEEGRDVIDVFRAMFPGGTITGCPKVRCMEIIHELEAQARGPYTGGIGYVGWDGSADMNILIRSFWHQGDMLHWAAGAGIVADSDPEAELAETGHKAAGLLRALRQACIL